MGGLTHAVVDSAVFSDSPQVSPNLRDFQVVRETILLGNPNVLDYQVFREAVIVPPNPNLRDYQVIREAVGTVPGGVIGVLASDTESESDSVNYFSRARFIQPQVSVIS